MTIWGTGRALREFLHVDDAAAAMLHVASLDDPPDWVNVGSGEEVSILELARMVAEVVGFTGEIRTDPEQARRHAAQSGRRVAAPFHRLAAANLASRRPAANVRGFPSRTRVRLVANNVRRRTALARRQSQN